MGRWNWYHQRNPLLKELFWLPVAFRAQFKLSAGYYLESPIWFRTKVSERPFLWTFLCLAIKIGWGGLLHIPPVTEARPERTREGPSQLWLPSCYGKPSPKQRRPVWPQLLRCLRGAIKSELFQRAFNIGPCFYLALLFVMLQCVFIGFPDCDLIARTAP